MNSKGVTTQTVVNSHLCVMIVASVALSQSQHIGVSHYLPMWLYPKMMSGKKSRVTIGLHFALALYARGPTNYVELKWHLMDIRHPHGPLPFLNKRESMFQRDLAATLRLRP